MRRALGAVLVALALTGCATTVRGTALPAGGAAGGGERALIGDYFERLNVAGAEGPTAQRDFLRKTQHPDFEDRFCDLGTLTLLIDPALSTLRSDTKWKPERSAQAPRGVVYVVGVSIRIRRDNSTLAEQIGSQRVVVLDGEAYGFTPCPTG